MLDRILNINPQEKYKSGLKISSNPYIVNRHDENKHHSHDSALFSPLAKLMSKINWKILKIEYPSDDEMFLNFLVNDLEFITVINFSEMYSNAYQEFSIYYINKMNRKKLQYNVKLKVEKDEINVLKRPDPIETEHLSLLFDRIAEMGISKNYSVIEPHILNRLINGISYSLNEELNYIIKVICTFISTKNKNRVKNNIILKTQRNNPIIMQKVAIINAE